MTKRVFIRLAKDGFRWRLVASNGRIIAESGEAYTRRRDAINAARNVFDDRPVVLNYTDHTSSVWVVERLR